MGLLLAILAAIALIYGVVVLLKGAILFGIILIVVGLLLLGGPWYFGPRGRTRL